MTRGKYKSTTEAREARETAMREAAALRRELERLQGEVTAERDALLDEREQLRADVFRLRGQLAEGVSDQLQSARAEIAALKAQMQEIPRTLGRRLARLIDEHDLLIPRNMDAVSHYISLAELFDLPLGELFTEGKADGYYGRDIRRMTAKKARRNLMAKQAGLDL